MVVKRFLWYLESLKVLAVNSAVLLTAVTRLFARGKGTPFSEDLDLGSGVKWIPRTDAETPNMIQTHHPPRLIFRNYSSSIIHVLFTVSQLVSLLISFRSFCKFIEYILNSLPPSTNVTQGYCFYGRFVLVLIQNTVYLNTY